MKKIFLFILFIVVSACGLLKRTSKTTEEDFSKVEKLTDLQASTILDYHKSGQQLLLRRDTTETNYSIRFWPRGILHVAPTGAVTGEFDSVMVVGKQRQLSSTSKSTNTNEASTAKSEQRLRQKEQRSSGKKRVEKQKSPQIILIVILSALVVLLIFLWIRKVFSPKSLQIF